VLLASEHTKPFEMLIEKLDIQFALVEGYAGDDNVKVIGYV
jgi:hypothetical protein